MRKEDLILGSAEHFIINMFNKFNHTVMVLSGHVCQGKQCRPRSDCFSICFCERNCTDGQPQLSLHCLHMSLVARKHVFRVSDPLRLKPTGSLRAIDFNLVISDTEPRDIILSGQRRTKTLILIHGWAGWSECLLVAKALSKFSHDAAHFMW